MSFEGFVNIIGTDNPDSWTPMNIGEVNFEPVSPRVLKATSTLDYNSAEEFRRYLATVLPALAARALWTRFCALQFDINDVREVQPGIITMHFQETMRMGDGRDPIGLSPLRADQWDIGEIRDEIIASILAHGNQQRTQALSQNAVLLHAVEDFIRAVLKPENALAHMYKAIEVIQNQLGGRRELTRLGHDKAYVDYVMSRANKPELNQRHAIKDVSRVEKVPVEEIWKCLLRTRTIIESFADSIA